MDWRDQSELQSGIRVLSRYAVCSWLDCRASDANDFDTFGGYFDDIVTIEAFSENLSSVMIEALSDKFCMSALLDRVCCRSFHIHSPVFLKNS